MSAETATENDELEISVEAPESWRRRLTVAVPASRVQAARRRERRALGRSLNLDGFRPGKVPPEIVEQRFGPVVEKRAVESLLEETFREALEREGIRPVSEPEIGDVRRPDEGGLTYRADLQVVPEISLDRIGGFRLERPEVRVDEEEVDEILARIRDEHAVWEPVERRPRVGDRVSVTIRPVEEEEGEDDGGRPYRFELGEGYAIPDVEEAISTLEPGGVGTFEVRFPDDFGDEELAGTERTLRIELVDVKEKHAPELDDDLAGEVGDFESLEALRDAVRDDLREHHEEEAEDELRNRILDSIVEANPFDVPEALVERYLDGLVDAPPEADEEEVRSARDSLRPAAERQLKRQLVLDRIIEREGFEATDDELEREIRDLAEEREAQPSEVRRQLAREDGLEALGRRIAVDEAFRFLKDASGLE